MPSVSTHVLDASAGGGVEGLTVELRDLSDNVVGSGSTDRDGRVASLASGLAPGAYRLSWEVGGDFVVQVVVTVALDEDRHYHVPLLVSAASAITYLGV